MKIKISQDAVKFVSPASPREVRSMAAKGLVPLLPRDVIKILYILCHDKDETVRTIADETLNTYSTKIIQTVLKEDIEAVIIDYLIRHHRDARLFAEQVLVNKNTSDETLIYLASGSEISILEILSTHHDRLMRSRPILDALINNPEVKGANRQRLLELADPSIRQRTGQQSTGDNEIRPEEGEHIPAAPMSHQESAVLTAALISDRQDDTDEHNIAARIQKMSVAEKIKFASRGNKEVRTILLKDPSKIVVAAVIKSPKITEEEILKIAQNKQASDEAIRIVTLNKEWLKNYAIRLALVYNPKTPSGIAMRLMPYLSKKDLRDLSASKNVPSLITTNAKKMLATKTKSS